MNDVPNHVNPKLLRVNTTIIHSCYDAVAAAININVGLGRLHAGNAPAIMQDFVRKRIQAHLLREHVEHGLQRYQDDFYNLASMANWLEVCFVVSHASGKPDRYGLYSTQVYLFDVAGQYMVHLPDAWNSSACIKYLHNKHKITATRVLLEDLDSGRIKDEWAMEYENLHPVWQPRKNQIQEPSTNGSFKHANNHDDDEMLALVMQGLEFGRELNKNERYI